MFDQLQRLHRIALLAGLIEEHHSPFIKLNEDLLRVPKPAPSRSEREQMYANQAAMNQRMNQQSYGVDGAPPPKPTGRFIAQLGRFWFSHDDHLRAIEGLEKKVAAAINVDLDGLLTKRKKALTEAEQLAEAIREITSDTSGEEKERSDEV
jgi:hypothetical protein